MRVILLAILGCLFAFANERAHSLSPDFELCYVSENYLVFDEIFGHVFMSHGEQGASFNLANYRDFKANLTAIFRSKALLQRLSKADLVNFYTSQNRRVDCYAVALSDTQNANISALFFGEDEPSTYSVFGRNCASALAVYASELDVPLRRSLLPARLISLNTSAKLTRSFAGLSGSLPLANTARKNGQIAPAGVLFSLNHSALHRLEFFSFDTGQILLAEISELGLSGFGYGVKLGHFRSSPHALSAKFFAGFGSKWLKFGASQNGAAAMLALWQNQTLSARALIDKSGANAELVASFGDFSARVRAGKNRLIFNIYKEF